MHMENYENKKEWGYKMFSSCSEMNQTLFKPRRHASIWSYLVFTLYLKSHWNLNSHSTARQDLRQWKILNEKSFYNDQTFFEKKKNM